MWTLVSFSPFRPVHPSRATTTDMYKSMCDITVDVSGMKQPPLPRIDGTGEKYYRVNYDVILLFGLTELQAQVAWEEDVRSPYNSLLVIFADNVLI